MLYDVKVALFLPVEVLAGHLFPVFPLKIHIVRKCGLFHNNPITLRGVFSQ